MIWLVWRRQRPALLAALGAVAVLIVVLAVGRWVFEARLVREGLVRCLDVDRPSCWSEPVWLDFVNDLGVFHGLTQVVLLLTPAVLGAVVGAGLFGRELERGTHVFTLTQATGRLRWWAAGLLVTAVPPAIAAVALTAVHAWAAGPLTAYLGASPLETPDFEISGVVPVGYTLLAFTLAATAGLVLRSTVGALAVGLVLMLAVQLVLSLAVRVHYLPPETARRTVPPVGMGDGDFGGPPGGLEIDYGYLDAAGREIAPRVDPSLASCDGSLSYSDCLRSIGLGGSYVRYQPASRYWPFQTIEAGILAALAAAALGAGAWGLRRRVR